MSTRLSAEADGLCDTHGFRRILALDATTFQMSDTDANWAEWPYAGCQKPGGRPSHRRQGVLLVHGILPLHFFNLAPTGFMILIK